MKVDEVQAARAEVHDLQTPHPCSLHVTWCFCLLAALRHIARRLHTATTLAAPQTAIHCADPRNPPTSKANTLPNQHDSAAVRPAGQPKHHQHQRAAPHCSRTTPRARKRRGPLAPLDAPLTKSAAAVAPAQPASAADGARGGSGEPAAHDGSAGGERARAGRLRRRLVYGGREGSGGGDDAGREREGVRGCDRRGVGQESRRFMEASDKEMALRE